MDFSQPKQIEAWLPRASVTWRAAILSRSLLRSLPELTDLVREADRTAMRTDLLLQTIRGHVSLSAFVHSNAIKGPILEEAERALSRVLRDAPRVFRPYPEKMARALQAIVDLDDTATARLLWSRSNDSLMNQVASDIEYLERTRSAKRLVSRRVYDAAEIGVSPNDAPMVQAEFVEELQNAEAPWRTWAAWFAAKLSGDHLFGLNHAENIDLDAMLAGLPSDVWRRGPGEIDLRFGGWIGRLHKEGGASLSTKEMGDVIVDFLDTFGGSATNEDIAQSLRDGGLRLGRSTMNWTLTNLVNAGHIVRVRRGVYASRQYTLSLDEFMPEDPQVLRDPEPQRIVALQFTRDESGKIAFDAKAGSHLLDKDNEAVERHSEVVRLGKRVITNFDPTAPGANTATELIQDVAAYLDAVGTDLEGIRPSLAVTRGDALRQLLSAQQSAGDLTDLPPLSDRYLLSLQQLVAAHNVMVGLDPFLAKRDEALLGPDVDLPLVGPGEGTRIVRIAVVAGVATTNVEVALAEEAANAPRTPSIESRVSRRYSEGIRNFGRAVLVAATATARFLWRHKGSIGGALVGLPTASIVIAKWAVANEAWFVGIFAENPMMLGVVRALIEALKRLPLS